MNIGIIGTRKRDGWLDEMKTHSKVMEFIKSKSLEKEHITIISGGAKFGGDRFAYTFARSMGLRMVTHFPDLSKPIPQCYFDRNIMVAIDSDVLFACVSLDRKGGTEHTIKKFKLI